MKRQPTTDEKKAFVEALAKSENPAAGDAERKLAKAQLQKMIKEFDCGCSFRDLLFKRLYQSARKGDATGAILNAQLFAKSFKHDSLKGLLKGLTGR